MTFITRLFSRRLPKGDGFSQESMTLMGISVKLGFYPMILQEYR